MKGLKWILNRTKRFLASFLSTFAAAFVVLGEISTFLMVMNILLR